MKNSDQTFYVTTPIYYVTAKPHLGSLYSTLLADVAARWHVINGKEVFLLTGTDEHGQKIAQAAQKAGMDPKQFVDSFAPAYQQMWDLYEIDYTQFIRTTDLYHVRAVQEWLRMLQKKGDIYKAHYSGWYCTPDESFVAESDLPGNYSPDTAPLCPSCGRQTHWVSEESYFFKLSAYADKLLEYYEQHPDFIVPKERINEVISFVKAGLKDLSISRTTITWGIPFPSDEAHVTYVWADALNNYITAIGYGDATRKKEFEKWWPADLQILGKDILRFHAVYWPAFLMASQLPVPKRLLVHGWIKINDQKMSKSLGNVIDPQILQEVYGVDCVRYYLTRYMAITQDSDFSTADLEKKIETDLANDLGNLLNRMLLLADKTGLYEVNAPEAWSAPAIDLRDQAWSFLTRYQNYMNDSLYYMALAELWKFINTVNAYFHAQEPWKLARSNHSAFVEVISATCHSLRMIGVLLWPVMPRKMEKLFNALSIEFVVGKDYIDLFSTDIWATTFMLKKIDPLFLKIEKNGKEETPVSEKNNTISFDQFAAIELIVGTVIACDLVEKSEKLYRLRVDFGDKKERQILSGVRAYFSPEDLIGKQGIFVFNLAPRMMVGLESQGMMLFAKDEQGNCRLISPTVPVSNGTRVS